MNDLINPKHIDVIPLPYRTVFSEFVCFNRVQSQVLEDILYSDESVVISAPTGSGKTVIFELGIVKLLMEYGSQNFQEFKIVYISPIKSLCQERLVDWNKKFSPFGINCVCVTGDSDNIDYQQLTNHNLIISTPEKWDSLTRKWRDNETLVRVVKLFMIDEVHLLNEDDRGSTLEVIVSRMKTVQNSIPRNEIDSCRIRFMAVSATIGNIDDIADWINCRKSFQFPEEMRPVQLKTIVLGYNTQNALFPFKFDLSLNYRLQSLIIQYSEGQPTLIFCSTRKSVEMTAKHLVQTLKIQISPLQSQHLLSVCNSIPDVKIRESIKHGVGIHHAGIAVNIRHNIETAFREGHMPILIATSTLAMGVNLPAHLVIIKSTKYYSNGTYQDYSATAIHQMIGRAGRPQFDTSATALILTSNENKRKVEKQLSSIEPVESNLHKHLTEHLNAEVVLGTITDLDVAMQWLASTFLYIRARKNPRHYGLPQTCRQDQIDKKLLEMFQIDLNKLMRVGMITMDEKINVTPTMTGKLMARYYVDFETMKMFTQISGTELFIQILALISKCQEFAELRLRVNDKKTLNLLNRNAKKDTIRFPLNGKIKTWDMKVNCIIQAVLGNLEITDPAIQIESQTILRNGQRIIRCLIDYLTSRKQNSYAALLNAIVLGKCMNAKLWENSPFISKQLSGIGSTFATQLANAGKNTFQKILESNPRDIEVIIKRKPPFGNYLLDEVRSIPRYSMSLDKLNQGLKLTIILENVEDLFKKSTIVPSSIMTLLVGNNSNEILLHEKYQISYTMENPQIIKHINIKSLNNMEFVEAHFISEDWVGIDRCCQINFNSGTLTESPKIVEKIPSENKPSYIQTFLDIYVKIKNPEKHNKDADDSKQIKNKQKPEKKIRKENPNKIKILYDELVKNPVDNSNENKPNEELDILEDHKIITAYKNNTEIYEDNLEAVEEIIYSNNDVQDYEEIVSCAGALEDEVFINDAPDESKEKIRVEEGLDKNGNNEGRDPDEDVIKETDITKKELEELFNSPILFSENETEKSSQESKENTSSNNLIQEFNAFTQTDRTLFMISQKYLTDVGTEDTNVSRSATKKNVTLRNILNVRGRKKRKLDDLHPAEELENRIHKEEQSYMDKFKKPQKKRMQQNNTSPSDNDIYKITEILEPNLQRHGPNSSDPYFDNKKSIKWRSPLVFSPGMKFSPKIKFKHAEIESQNDGYNDSFEATSSTFSRNFSTKVQKTPKRSKIDNSIPKFLISDRDCENYQEARKSDGFNKFSDICSTQLLDSFRPKDTKHGTPTRVFNQTTPTNVVDFYSQQVARYTPQKSPKKNLTLSQSPNENKENPEEPEVDLNSPHPRYESTEKDAEYPRFQSDLILSQNRPMRYDHPTRSEEYINAKIRDNYPVYPDFDVPSTSRYNPSSFPVYSHHEFDTGSCLNSSINKTRTRSLPKMHYPSYVDPVQYGYHSNYDQYVRPCCEYPTDVCRRLPPEYLERDIGHTIGHNIPQFSPNVEPRCSTSYPTELSQQMTPRQRAIPRESYVEARQMVPNSTVTSCHIYGDPVEQDLNSSFVIRNPSCSINCQAQNIPYPYGPSYYPRGHPHSYEYFPKNPTSHIDKDYVMNKYWSSFNSQQ